MKILAIEAAAKVAGCALLCDGRIVASQTVNGPLTHSETLMPMVSAVLSASETEIEAVDAIALTAGPGSFTGLRIAAATAKGLALGRHIPLIPIPTLESLSYNVNGWPYLTVTVMDARRSQLYCAVWKQGECLLPADARSPEALAEYLKPLGEKALFLGDAADLYRNFFAEALGENYLLAAPSQKDLSPASTASLAAERFARGEGMIPGSELRPDYLRKPQAEREREEREKNR